jgi:hypothetical protein
MSRDSWPIDILGNFAHETTQWRYYDHPVKDTHKWGITKTITFFKLHQNYERQEPANNGK